MTPPPRVHRSVAEWRAAAAAHRAAGRSIGFVPTMGALHEGHASLARRASATHQASLASIFINPTQFDEPSDFAAYPQTPEADLALLHAAGTTDVLMPPVAEIYPDGRRYWVRETTDSLHLEGAARPGHFDGMLTVVLRLLLIAEADVAYFGEKDWQQLRLVQGLARAFHLRTHIEPCPTIREADGLAMSSRNSRLSPAERALAPRFAAALRESTSATEARERLARDGFTVDYVEDWDSRRLGAVRLGRTRLIDNIPIPDPQTRG